MLVHRVLFPGGRKANTLEVRAFILNRRQCLLGGSRVMLPLQAWLLILEANPD